MGPRLSAALIADVPHDPPLRERLTAAGFELCLACPLSDLERTPSETLGAVLLDERQQPPSEALLQTARRAAPCAALVALVQDSSAAALRLLRLGFDDVVDAGGTGIDAELVARCRATHVARRDEALRWQALARSEENHRRLVENCNDAILQFDLNGALVYANAAAGRMVGYAPSELAANAGLLRRLVHSDFAEQFEQVVSGLREGRVPQERTSWTLLHRDGHLVHTEHSCSVLIDAAGRTIGFETVARDVSDLRRIEASLREPLARLTHHMENAPLAVVEWDREFRCARWSSQAEIIFGWRADEVLGKHPHDWPIVFEQDAPAVDGVMARLIDGREKRNRSINRNYRKDGAVLTCEWNNSVLLDPNGRLISILSLVSDVTQRECAIDALRSAHLSLERRVAERTAALQRANLRLREEIAERRNAEAAMCESERFARATVDAIASHIAIIDEHGQILAVNRAWERYAIENAGDPRLVGVGANYLSACDRAGVATDAARVARGVRAVIAGDVPLFELEYPCHSPAARAWFVLRATRFPGEGPVRVVITHENVTDRIVAADALRRTTEEVSDLYNNAPCGYHSLDRAGRIARINATEAAWLGYTSEELIGRPMRDFVAPESRTHFDETFEQFLRSGEQRGVEFELLRRDGSRIPVLKDSTSVRDAAGNIIRSRSTLYDLTEQKRASAALRAIEERNRRIVETSFEGIFLVDPQQRITFANRRLGEMLGFELSQLTGRAVYDLCDDSEREFLSQLLARRERGITDSHDHCFIRRDGSALWVLISCAALFDADGSFSGTLVMLTDITARRQAESALRDSQERLRQAERLASIGTLAAGIAHEINNPVGSILLAADFALSQRGRDGAAELTDACLADIVREARRCGRIVKSVLQFARREPTEKWLGDVNAVVERAVHLSRRFADDRQALLQLKLAAGVPRVELNPIQIEQAMVNLIRNAIESGERGVNVDVGTERTDLGVRLYVRDNGRGMTPDEKKHMFDPFFTLRVNEGGTGLGLSIVHGVVAEHGGSIDVETQPRRGTTVSILLPTAVGASVE